MPGKGAGGVFDAEGNKTAEFVLEAGGECPGIQVPIGDSAEDIEARRKIISKFYHD